MKLTLITFNPEREISVRFSGKVGLRREWGEIELTVAPSRVARIRQWIRHALAHAEPDENWHVAHITAEVTHPKDSLGNATVHRVSHLGFTMQHIDTVKVRRNVKRGEWSRAKNRQ